MKAPELNGGIAWLNTSHPVTLKELRGKFVLLDFWTFCCINCMHIIPDLQKLEDQYPSDLVVVGVHSAKFENEKQTDNIREAILRYGIHHPVVNDANFKIWQAYTVHSWPTLVLIDPTGNIVEAFSGEGNYKEIVSAIERLKPKFAGQMNEQTILFDQERFKTHDTALSFPGKVVGDTASDRLFISDSGHNRIVITKSDGHDNTEVGSGAPGLQDGPYKTAQFRHPQGMCVSGDKLYVADTENHAIRLVDLTKQTVTTLAGDGVQANSHSKGGDGKSTRLSSPWDLTLVDNKLYIAMAGMHQIWCMDLKSDHIAPYAGNGRENIVDGPLAGASLAQPSGITSDGKKLYFVDSEVSAVREADLSSDGKVRTLVGEGLFDFGDQDGIGNAAKLQHPLGITWHEGKLYIADSYNHKIKVIDPVTRSCRTLIGTGTAGSSLQTLSEPGGLTFLGQFLFIADTNNNQIKKGLATAKDAFEFEIAYLWAPPNPALPPDEHREEKATTAQIVHAHNQSAGEKPYSPPPKDINFLPAMPNAFKVELPSQTIHPGSGNIIVDVDIPHQYHLNKDTSVDYFFKEEPNPPNPYLIFDPSKPDTRPLTLTKGTIRPPHLPISIPFTCVEGQTKLRTIVTLYYCGEGKDSLCYIRTLDVTAPIAVSSTSKISDINIKCSLPAQN